MPKQTKPSIVFAHGLWADGSCFQKLITGFRRTDTRRARPAQPRLAGRRRRRVTRGLGGLAARWFLSATRTVRPDHACGDERPGCRPGLHRRPRTRRDRNLAKPAGAVPGHGRLLPHRDRGRADLVAGQASGVSQAICPSRSKGVWATQSVPVPDLFIQKLDGMAWRSKPSWYIVANDDRTVHPDLERFAAKRMGATTFETRRQPCPDAVQSRLRPRRHPRGREDCHFSACGRVITNGRPARLSDRKSEKLKYYRISSACAGGRGNACLLEGLSIIRLSILSTPPCSKASRICSSEWTPADLRVVVFESANPDFTLPTLI